MNEVKKKVIDEKKEQGVKLGYGKGSSTGNDPDNTKEFREKNPKFKMNIKSTNKKVTKK